jgi:hypothetical protein
MEIMDLCNDLTCLAKEYEMNGFEPRDISAVLCGMYVAYAQKYKISEADCVLAIHNLFKNDWEPSSGEMPN